MDIFCSDEKKLIIIDLALNIFLTKRAQYRSEQKFDQDIKLSPSWIKHLQDEIITLQAQNPEAMIGINFEYIHYFENSHAFVGFGQNISDKSKVFFFNLRDESEIQEKICSDLNYSNESIFYDSQRSILFFSQLCAVLNGDELLSSCYSVVQQQLSAIVRDLIVPLPEAEMLSSSNFYTNQYVDIKQLFMDPKKLNLVLFYMAKALLSQKIKCDALVATSKNGAILATLIGGMIDKKTVYCVNVGPQYALSANAIENAFEKDNRYIYICDFVCIGTEVKLLYALLTSQRAHFCGGIGIASYIPLDNPDLIEKRSPLSKVKCLVNLVDTEISYSISIKK